MASFVISCAAFSGVVIAAGLPVSEEVTSTTHGFLSAG
jgi:hypothetical protein